MIGLSDSALALVCIRAPPIRRPAATRFFATLRGASSGRNQVRRPPANVRSGLEFWDC